jgi:hypothetical protein
MQHLEGSGTPVLYIGHMVLKGKCSNYSNCYLSTGAIVFININFSSQYSKSAHCAILRNIFVSRIKNVQKQHR